MDATQLLKKDHDTVRELFERYDALDEDATAEKQALFTELRRELEMHSEIEEEIFYPAVRGIGTDDAEGTVEEAVEEHAEVKALLQEISAMRAGDDEFDDRVEELRDAVEHHAEEEESEMFAAARQHLASRLEELGRQLEARKETLKLAAPAL